MARLSKPQLRCLAAVAAGYGGYRWIEGDNITRGRRSEHDAPKPIYRLLALGLIEHGEVKRPFSGCRITPYVITEVGRAALAKEAESHG